ncbi:hybrid signal transduction histidine kinase M, partial [Tanacetum coccineum]
MAGDDSIPPKPHTPNEKPFGITNIKTYIPLVLDLNELNYDSNDRATKEWGKLDSLVKLWIFGTISKSLLQRVLKKNVSAHDVWKSLNEVFHDNKTDRVMQLDTELRTIKLSSLSITDYCHKISRTADLLGNINSSVDEKNLVTYAINGLTDKYEGVVGIICHRDPPPTFTLAQSMLLLEESRLNHRSTRQPTRDSTTSSPHVLLDASNNRNNNSGARLCHNFQHGLSYFGERCRYVHTNPTSAAARNGNENN